MNQNPQILIVDDDLSICQILGKILTGQGYQVMEAHSGNEALQLFAENEIDLVLLDLAMPDVNGIEVATKMIAQNPLVPIVLITAYGTISKAVEATKLGVYDFLEKPPDRDRIIVTVRNALAHGQLQQKLEHYKEDSLARYKMVGQSPAIKKVYQLIEQVAPTNSPVLILGENGVGKELVARAIHDCSPRAKKPMVEINCAAIPDELMESELFGHTKGAFTGAHTAKKGRFEMADGGTLFLDEVGDLSPLAQAKLLRFLETGEIQRVGATEISMVDVRVLAASNKNLNQMVKDQSFREDLYNRLDVFRIKVPPLRDRKDDLPLLLDHFLTEYADKNEILKPQFTPAAINFLTGYNWPGNVRQVRNFVSRLMIMKQGDLIDLDTVRPLLEEGETSSVSTTNEPKPLHEAG
ncbi:MAG: sigma-54 dependent transcriptional regulator, partial [candidate division KSB1 bacterium]|nr:sigma-54 dependent transcriptional regulator [candidate division KSB1 bacterium]